MMATASAPVLDPLAKFVPPSLRKLADPQRDIPRIAKDTKLVEEIEASLRTVPTNHVLRLQDARFMHGIAPCV
jgi:hypothetical protein